MTLLKWSEPRDYTRALYKNAARPRKWSRPIIAIFAALVMLATREVAKLDPHKTPPPFWVAVPLAITFGFFVTYGIPWMYSFAPSQIRMTEKAIFRSNGQSARTIKPNLIASYHFEESHGYIVLRFIIPSQVDLLCALPKNIEPAHIERVLAELKIPRRA